MRSTVKQHKRKVKNKVVTVTRHARGKYGKKPKNDKYPPRDNASVDLATLQAHYKKYQEEFTKLLNGQLTSSDQHKSFIARRLRAAARAIKLKQKRNKNSDN
jgi:branched-subunit amino acid aminotransferase/4-amino-4-deoxychorismate lyase